MKSLADTTLSFHGTLLAVEQEHEIKFNNKTGINARITKKDGKVRDLFNLTEVHWNYQDKYFPNYVAFESDIHCSGFSFAITDIESVELTAAASVNEEIFEAVAA